MAMTFFLCVMLLCILGLVMAENSDPSEHRGLQSIIWTPRTVPPLPYFRYRLWDDLSNEARQNALTMNYNQFTWELPGTNIIESFSYETIRDTLLDELIQAVDALGFNPDVWDCHINHYEDYSWQELADDQVQTYFVTLGWTQVMWESQITMPESDDKFWSQLTQDERNAAENICFNQELWNGISLDDWPALPPDPTPSPTNNPTTSPTTSPAPTESGVTRAPTSPPVATESPTPAPISPTEPPTPAPTTDKTRVIPPPIDHIRYVVWKKLTDEMRKRAVTLGYSE